MRPTISSRYLTRRLPPLDRVEIDLDIKLPGREEELVEALRERGLVERSMISTMEMHTLKRILELEPALRRGWTYPKVTKDWNSKRWARLPILGAMVAMRLCRCSSCPTRRTPRSMC